MQVPEEFKAIFWDVCLDSLDIVNHRKYIIERILNYGDLPEYRWLFQTYSRQDIIDELRNNRNIQKKSAVMVANFLEVPKENLLCLKNVSELNWTSS